MPVIHVSGLRKSYGEHEVVRGIDLEVHRGEVFAFLGPNGAGKTTTVEILEGYRSRSAGEVRVLEEDPASADGRWRSGRARSAQASGSARASDGSTRCADVLCAAACAGTAWRAPIRRAPTGIAAST